MPLPRRNLAEAGCVFDLRGSHGRDISRRHREREQPFRQIRRPGRPRRRDDCLHRGRTHWACRPQRSGKSTFLQIAAGVARAESGEFSCRRDLVTGYMPQVSGLDDTTTVHANILNGAQRILDLIAEYERVPGDSPLSATLLDRVTCRRRLEFGTSDQVAHHQFARAGIRSHRGDAFRRGKTPCRAVPGASGASRFSDSRRTDQPYKIRTLGVGFLTMFLLCGKQMPMYPKQKPNWPKCRRMKKNCTIISGAR